jgi:hypothetical protein
MGPRPTMRDSAAAKKFVRHAKRWMQQKKDLESLGIDASHVDKYIKKYGIK